MAFKKIIIIIIMLLSVFFIFNSINCSAVEEWGNLGFYGDITTYYPFNLVNDWNCQKHVFYKDGEITNITFPVIGTGCNYTFAVLDSIESLSYYGVAPQEFINTDFSQTTDVLNFNVTAGQELYFCLYRNSGFCTAYGDSRISPVYQTNSHYARYTNVSVEGEFGIYTGNSFPLTQRYGFDQQPINIFKNIIGGYIYNDNTGNMFGINGVKRKISTNRGGEIFYFDHDTVLLQGVEMLLATGKETFGTEAFKIGMNINQTGEDLFNCTYEYNDLTDSDGALIYCPVNDILLNKNETYFLYAECFKDNTFTTNCDGNLNWVNMITNRHRGGLTVNSPYMEWQSYDTNRSYSTGYLYEDVYFKLYLDEDITFFELECPLSLCMYYDDFLQNTELDLISNGYTGNTETALFNDSKIYFNATATNYPYIIHNLYPDTYSSKEGFLIFDFNYKTTPEFMKTETITYLYSIGCDNDLSVMDINFAFKRDDVFSGSENRTVLNVYTIDNGIKNHGTYTFNNDNLAVVKFSFDDSNQLTMLQVKQTADIQSLDLSNTPDFLIDYYSTCENFKDIQFSRRDHKDNESSNYDIGIDSIYIYGLITDADLDDLDYDYTNETNQTTAMIKTEINEELHNLAFTLGFKTTATKLLFWFLIIGFLISAVLFSDGIDANGKKYAMVLISIIGLITGWYLKFIPTVLLAFLIFIFAVFGAYVVTHAFKNN